MADATHTGLSRLEGAMRAVLARHEVDLPSTRPFEPGRLAAELEYFFSLVSRTAPGPADPVEEVCGLVHLVRLAWELGLPGAALREAVTVVLAGRPDLEGAARHRVRWWATVLVRAGDVDGVEDGLDL